MLRCVHLTQHGWLRRWTRVGRGHVCAPSANAQRTISHTENKLRLVQRSVGLKSTMYSIVSTLSLYVCVTMCPCFCVSVVQDANMFDKKKLSATDMVLVFNSFCPCDTGCSAVLAHQSCHIGSRTRCLSVGHVLVVPFMKLHVGNHLAGALGDS